ncbi:SpoIIE family protein phosphatase [Aquibacillus sp. 3ASR75-11]|uniref:SpoIIE family protein phosphatase n=1 Tax=Terrihalobacillus insolitus TaxID=2950438 RepID=A0A9X4AQ51_9BACI|nr:SpoIIE family protein phosphatase [Terrihalobacillus insolitus]MDC3415238.1 SpoIIE family protein phosphatase [Terrihalobacillus insolitus]MDC3426278.1 SpoIIE family protein phosphatase [Terrihalobacillus insolitus]
MEKEKHIDLSVYQKPKKGNYLCGDSYFYKETNDSFVCALADGLGSGEYAKESSEAVIDIIQQHIDEPVGPLIKKCNESLIGKRGVVLGILKMDFNTKTYSFSSIGNIGIMTILSDYRKKRSIPNAGYLGNFSKKFKIATGNLEHGMTFVMFSDGVHDRDLSAKYFLDKDVQIITECFEVYGAKNRDDDTTLIAIKYYN